MVHIKKCDAEGSERDNGDRYIRSEQVCGGYSMSSWSSISWSNALPQRTEKLTGSDPTNDKIDNNKGSNRQIDQVIRKIMLKLDDDRMQLFKFKSKSIRKIREKRGKIRLLKSFMGGSGGDSRLLNDVLVNFPLIAIGISCLSLVVSGSAIFDTSGNHSTQKIVAKNIAFENKQARNDFPYLSSAMEHQQQQHKSLIKSTSNGLNDIIECQLDSRRRPCGLRQPQQNKNKNLFYIVGGEQVEEDNFWPWSIAIYELDPLNGLKTFICSGSLISDRFVLTAAHCVQQSRFDILQPNEVFVKVASVKLNDESASFFRVERIFLHPNYASDKKPNDIALIKLASDQRLPERAAPICLPSQVANRVDFTDQHVTIIGWGRSNPRNGNEPARLIDYQSTELSAIDWLNLGRSAQVNNTLQQAEVRVKNTDQCNQDYKRFKLNIDEHFLCASDPDGRRDACQGDSGGPLMWSRQQQRSSYEGGDSGDLDYNELESAQGKWYQLGLVSFGRGCANSQYPGVYTRISYYMPWILKTMKAARDNNSDGNQVN